MSDKPDPPFDPYRDDTPGRPGEVPGCPTGMRPDTTTVRGPLGVEKLEGRQESGRDEQDEAEEDEPDA
jgi:hypothetical protein